MSGTSSFVVTPQHRVVLDEATGRVSGKLGELVSEFCRCCVLSGIPLTVAGSSLSLMLCHRMATIIAMSSGLEENAIPNAARVDVAEEAHRVLIIRMNTLIGEFIKREAERS